MLELVGVSKSYQKYKSGKAGFCLNNISLQFGEIGLVVIVGKSGSGKTTLINLASMLDVPTSGKVLINNNVVGEHIDVDTYRSQCVSFVFQKNNLFSNRSVFRNVALPLTLTNHKIDRQGVRRIIRSVEIEGLTDKKIKYLSGGEEQRASVARALIKDTPIIFADEPTANLDDKNSDNIFSILKSLSKERLVIVVSHDLDRCYQFADRVIELEDGSVIKDIVRAEGESEDLIEIDACGTVTPQIVESLNRRKRILTMGDENQFRTKDSNVMLLACTRVYRKSKALSISNLLALTRESIYGSKIKAIVMMVVCALLIAFMGLSMLISGYDRMTGIGLSYAQNSANSLTVVQGSRDPYGNIVKAPAKLNDKAVDDLRAQFSEKMLMIKNVSGLNIALSGMEDEAITPTEIAGVVEMSESDLEDLGYRMMDFPYMDDNTPAMQSRFPTTGMPVAVGNDSKLKVNEIAITDYLAYVLYREYFELNIESLPQPEDPSQSKLESFLHSGFERIFLQFEQLFFMPNRLRVVAILDTGYKSKYFDILSGDYATTDRLFKDFVSDVNSRHSFFYSGSGFAETCYTNNLQGEFQYVTTASDKYGYYNRNNLITYIASYSGELGENDVLIDIQAFQKYTQSEFDANAVKPYRFAHSYDNTEFDRLNIVGVIDTRQKQEFQTHGLVVSDTFLQTLARNNCYTVGAQIQLNDGVDTDALLRYLDGNAMYAHISNIDLIESVSGNIDNLKTIFLPILLVSIVLSFLMLCVFLCGNIAGKKYNAGIYRCFGASKADIVKYLAIETSLYIGVIALLAGLLLLLFTNVANAILYAALGTFDPTYLSGIALLYAQVAPYAVVTSGTIAVGVAVVAYPMLKLSKMSPAESIRRAD